MERCKRCGKLMSGEICQYCSLMDSLNNSNSKTSTPAKSYSEISIGTKSRASIPKIGLAPTINSVSHPASSAGSPIIDCIYEPVITVSHEPVTNICVVSLTNTRILPQDLNISVDINDKNEYTRMIHLDGKEELKHPIELSTKKLVSEYSSSLDISIGISSSDGKIIYRQSFTLIVRPIFDVRLDDIEQEIPRWVTPNNLEIKSLLTTGGAVLNALESSGNPDVSGYQGKDANYRISSAIRQLRAVYDGLKSLDIKYVSDTHSLGNDLTYNFQRIKLPYKVLEDRTGNCIELSCLFASVLEAMGLYPVIIYPPGHAIVGVLLSSDHLPQINDYDVEEHPTVINLNIPDIGNGMSDDIQAVFVESTAICTDASYENAVNYATSTIKDNLEYIQKEKRFTVIVYERHFHNKAPMSNRGD